MKKLNCTLILLILLLTTNTYADFDKNYFNRVADIWMEMYRIPQQDRAALKPTLAESMYYEWDHKCYQVLDMLDVEPIPGIPTDQALTLLPKCDEYPYPPLKNKGFVQVMFTIYGAWLAGQVLTECRSAWDEYMQNKEKERMDRERRERIRRENERRNQERRNRERPIITRPAPIRILPGNGLPRGGSWA